MEVPVDRCRQELLDCARRELRVGHREHESAVRDDLDRAPSDGEPGADRGDRLAGVLEHGGEADRDGPGQDPRHVERPRASSRKCRPARPRRRTAPAPAPGGARRARTSVLTPIDQPISTAWSIPKLSITERPSCTKCWISTCEASAGRSEPPVPRWFQDTTRTPHAGSSSAGHAYGLVPRPLHSTTVGPSINPSGRWSRRAAGCRRRTERRGTRARRWCRRHAPRRSTCLNSARACTPGRPPAVVTWRGPAPSRARQDG